jgi:serine/threonine protein kinase
MFKQKSESGYQWAAALKELYISLYLSGKKYFPKVEKVFYTNDDEGNTPFNIMYEYIEGEILEDFIKTLSTKKEYDIFKNKIQDILDYFCKVNIVHNDFHLSNIMVIKKEGGDYDLKVIDFGLTSINKCDPSVELIKLISIMYMKNVNKEILDIFIELYREKYLVNEKCVVGDKFFFFGKKYISSKDVYKEMKKGLSSKFFEMCYYYYFNNITKLNMSKSYDVNNKLFYFNIEKKTKYTLFLYNGEKKIDFAPYKNYFSKM